MNKSPNQNHKKIRTAPRASANGRVKALTGLLRVTPARPLWLGGPGRAGRFPSGPQPIVVSWGF